MMSISVDMLAIGKFEVVNENMPVIKVTNCKNSKLKLFGHPKSLRIEHYQIGQTKGFDNNKVNRVITQRETHFERC